MVKLPVSCDGKSAAQRPPQPYSPQTLHKAPRIAGAVAGLAGGLALRWAISQAGHPSASDPQAARDASRRPE